MSRSRFIVSFLSVGILAYALTSFRHIEPSDRFLVADSPILRTSPRLLAGGWSFLPRLIYRISSYPNAPVNLRVDLRGDHAAVSREGSRVEVEAELLYTILPERVLDLHRTHGPDYETGWLTELLRRETAKRLAGVSYDLVRNADPDLTRGVQSVLQERVSEAGILVKRLRIVETREPGTVSAEILRVDARPTDRQVVVIGVDSFDWNIIDPLIERGKMPNLAHLVERGTRANLRTIIPILSPVIWTSIATGVKPSRHGIVDFVVTADDTGELLPVTSAMRQVPALWTLLSRQGFDVSTVAWWATWPAETVRGTVVTDRVAYQLFQKRVKDDWKDESPERNRGKTYPAGLIDEVRPLIRLPAEVTDEEVAWFLPGRKFPDSLTDDQRELLTEFRTVIAAGETYHAIALRQFGDSAAGLKMVYYEGPDTVSHLFMRYRPPLLAGVDPADMRLFGGIVDRYYQRQDRFLGEILEAVGDDANILIVSDHGFKSAANRPPHSDSRIGKGDAAKWHTPVGVLVLAGPAIRHGFDLDAASILDITPTVLVLAGFPAARDMDGQPLAEALTGEFLDRHPVGWIDSYGGYRPGGREAARMASAGSPDDAEHIEKLRSLGYLGTERKSGHNNRGLMALQEGDVDTAIEEFELALAGGDGTGTMIRSNLALARLVGGDPDEALALADEVLREDPRNKEAQLIRARVQIERGDLEAAEATLKKAIAIDPTYVQARSKLGLVYQRKGNDQAALAEFRKVVEIAPLSANEYNHIGNIHRRRGEIDLAIEAYQEALRDDARFIGAYNNLGLCLQEKGRLREARELYEKALAIRPENPILRNSLGTLIALEGDKEAALAEFERAVQTDPGWPVAQGNLATLLFEEGRFAEAAPAFAKLVELEPESVESRLGYALSLLMNQERGRAIKQFDEILLREPGNLRARIALGETLLREGKLERAQAHLEEAVRIDARIPRVYNSLGEVYMNRGLNEEAGRVFRKSLAIDPEQETIRRRLAEATP